MSAPKTTIMYEIDLTRWTQRVSGGASVNPGHATISFYVTRRDIIKIQRKLDINVETLTNQQSLGGKEVDKNAIGRMAVLCDNMSLRTPDDPENMHSARFFDVSGLFEDLESNMGLCLYKAKLIKEEGAKVDRYKITLYYTDGAEVEPELSEDMLDFLYEALILNVAYRYFYVMHNIDDNTGIGVVNFVFAKRKTVDMSTEVAVPKVFKSIHRTWLCLEFPKSDEWGPLDCYESPEAQDKDGPLEPKLRYAWLESQKKEAERVAKAGARFSDKKVKLGKLASVLNGL